MAALAVMINPDASRLPGRDPRLAILLAQQSDGEHAMPGACRTCAPVDIALTGVVLGGMYALIAMGLTLQYGVARIMNLSHGEGMVAAAFGAHWAFSALVLSPLVGLIVALPLAFAVNWLVYRIVLMPLVRRAKNAGMLEVTPHGTSACLCYRADMSPSGQFYSYSYMSFGDCRSTVALPTDCDCMRARHRNALYWRTPQRAGHAIVRSRSDPVGSQLVATSARRADFCVALAARSRRRGVSFPCLTFTAAMGVVSLTALCVIIVGSATSGALSPTMLGSRDRVARRSTRSPSPSPMRCSWPCCCGARPGCSGGRRVE